MLTAIKNTIALVWSKLTTRLTFLVLFYSLQGTLLIWKIPLEPKKTFIVFFLNLGVLFCSAKRRLGNTALGSWIYSINLFFVLYKEPLRNSGPNLIARNWKSLNPRKTWLSRYLLITIESKQVFEIKTKRIKLKIFI